MASIEIGEEGVESLRLLKECSDGEIRGISRAVVSVLLGSEREASAIGGPMFEQKEVDLIKRVYSALVCLFVEAAKKDVAEKSVPSFLRSECGVPEAQGALIGEVFRAEKAALRKELCRTGNFSSLPRLAGVDWRLEYRVSTAEEEDRPPRELLYHVSLKTLEKEELEPGKTDGKTDFVCSIEQLQDLVSTLKDACKTVERVVHQG